MKAATITASVICFLAGMGTVNCHAQSAPIEFRLMADKANPVGCNSLDPSLSRVHTVSLMGDKAMVKSAGGINDTLKQTSPQVYRTTFRLGDVTLDVVADASAVPRTLSVAEAKRGCRWNAVAR